MPRRNGVQPDAHFYATLMGVVGAAGNLRLAMQLREEMALDGLPPCQVLFVLWPRATLPVMVLAALAPL